jgi:L-ascorbate peroxidase
MNDVEVRPTSETTLLADPVETKLRDYLRARMAVEHAPAQLRLAFHDAGTYDVKTHSGGAHGAIHLLEEAARTENAGWSSVCLDLLAQARASFPGLSWADLVAVAGAVAVEVCGGPRIQVGLGRVDSPEPAPEHRLPTTDEGAARLKSHFERMGMGARELVALSGGHTLGRCSSGAFTPDPLVFSNSYFRHVASRADDVETALLDSDRALMDDPELRDWVEIYAADEARFVADFAGAYYRLTWLGAEAGPQPLAS